MLFKIMKCSALSSLRIGISFLCCKGIKSKPNLGFPPFWDRFVFLNSDGSIRVFLFLKTEKRGSGETVIKMKSYF